VPTQTGIAVPAVTLTLGVMSGFTVIVVPAEVAVVGEAQPALEVITTVTTCPLVNVELVKVAPVAPETFTPLICH
jgi:hypothetical protein